MNKSSTLLLLLCLSGCATPYWQLTAEPVEVKYIVRVDYPCASVSPNAWGCWNSAGQTIEIKKGLTPQQELCVIRHEYAHARGYRHPENRVAQVSGSLAPEADCGP